MAAPSGNSPPLGVVIKNDDGSNSIWNGKQWAPAKQGADGSWGVDTARMAAMGMGAAAGAINPDDAKRVASMQTDFDNVDGLANTATDFMTRNAATPTGGLLAIPGATTIAKAVQGSSSDLAAMDRDNSQMAVQMRTPGMRLTQMEFGKFLGATPSPKNTADQNQQIAKSIYAARTLAAAKSSFYTTWLNTHRSLAGADAAWLGWRNQHFDPTLSQYTPDSPGSGANAALKGRSAQTQAGTTIDINGNPVGP